MSDMSNMELGLVYGRECLFYRCTMLLGISQISGYGDFLHHRT